MDFHTVLDQISRMSFVQECIQFITPNARLILHGFLVCFAAVGLRAQGAKDSWSGVWQTYWRGGGAILDLSQSGQEVSGTYPLYAGNVEAKAQGRKLEGRWFEQSGREGEFLFVMARDRQTFMGRFENGEWWTGMRMSSSSAYRPIQADLSSPRETLRSLIMASQAAEKGYIELIQPALETIDFSDMTSAKLLGRSALPQERIEYVRLFAKILDQFTFRIWDLPGESLPGSTNQDDVQVQFQQPSSTNVLDISFIKKNQSWLLDPIAPEILEEHLRILEESRFRRLDLSSGTEYKSANSQMNELRFQIHPNLSSPRATMRQFLDTIEHFDLGGSGRVYQTMDLAALNVQIHEEEAELLAYYLKQILDRIGLTILQENSK